MKQLIIVLTLVFGLTTQATADKQKSTPWKGTPQAVPGKVEAEHYDEGPADVAYHDVEKKNLGEPYRRDTEVDIEKRNDASNGHGVGWTRKGEWLNYTINVAANGRYQVLMPVASNGKGGTFHFELGGKDISGPVHVPDTGGWDKLKMITHGALPLRKGTHTVRIVMDQQGPSGSIGDIDYFEFRLKP